MTAQSATAALEEELNAVTEVALRLIGDNDMLLDMLSELGCLATPVSVQEQLAQSAQSDLEGLDTEYWQDVPDHFKSLPWDLDLRSSSGSHLEDFAKVNLSSASTMAPQTTEISGNSARKVVRTPVMKKRSRDGEEDQNGTSARKKKRKSMLDQSSTTWSP